MSRGLAIEIWLIKRSRLGSRSMDSLDLRYCLLALAERVVLVDEGFVAFLRLYWKLAVS